MTHAQVYAILGRTEEAVTALRRVGLAQPREPVAVAAVALQLRAIARDIPDVAYPPVVQKLRAALTCGPRMILERWPGLRSGLLDWLNTEHFTP